MGTGRPGCWAGYYLPVATSSNKPSKRRVESGGRVTPKGGPASRKNPVGDNTSSFASSRYTPPVPGGSNPPSPAWVPVLMFSLFGLGMLTLILNYVSLLPGAVSNWYLLAGLGFILGGIVTATQYR
jgi:hypothetical protein